MRETKVLNEVRPSNQFIMNEIHKTIMFTAAELQKQTFLRVHKQLPFMGPGTSFRCF